jgi:hypothetical protein
MCSPNFTPKLFLGPGYPPRCSLEDRLLVKNVPRSAVVSLQRQSTPDLSTSFTNHGPPVDIEVNLPGNQHFLRLRALGPQ